MQMVMIGKEATKYAVLRGNRLVNKKTGKSLKPSSGSIYKISHERARYYVNLASGAVYKAGTLSAWREKNTVSRLEVVH